MIPKPFYPPLLSVTKCGEVLFWMMAKPTISQNCPPQKKPLSLTSKIINIGRCTLWEWLYLICLPWSNHCDRSINSIQCVTNHWICPTRNNHFLFANLLKTSTIQVQIFKKIHTSNYINLIQNLVYFHGILMTLPTKASIMCLNSFKSIKA